MKKDGKKKPPFWTPGLILSAIGVAFSHSTTMVRRHWSGYVGIDGVAPAGFVVVLECHWLRNHRYRDAINNVEAS
ncbi:hypothetical protein ACNKHX_21405 [Shigella flexneri]